MKKSVISSFILASVVALALAGCGNTETKPAASGTDAAAAQPASGDAAAAGGAKEIKVTAKNFEFDQKEIHVKKGDKVKLTLNSAEGLHGIEIPDLGVTTDDNGNAEFTADKAGEFAFKCSIVCGAGHDTMTGKLIVEE